jgi:plastocyanin
VFENRFEIFGWLLAVVVVAVMGVLVFHGPFKKINKPVSAAAAAPPVQTVKIVNNSQTIGAYSPKSVTIKVGQAIAFKNVSSVPHSVTANNNSFNSGLVETGGTWIFRAKKAGTFPYYCFVHPNMHGTLTVKA